MIDCVVLLVTSNVSNSKLKYWLDYGELLSAGEMKQHMVHFYQLYL